MNVQVGLKIEERAVRIPVGGTTLDGDLSMPEGARGVVLFAHGSGSNRHSTRNRHVAAVLQEAKVATLLLDLRMADEETADVETEAERLIGAAEWLAQYRETRTFQVGYFGGSSGAGAALAAAADRPELVSAIVCRGGRPDLAGSALPRVEAPTLLIVGAADLSVMRTNRTALTYLRSEKKLVIVPRATHLFEEPGAMDEVARLTKDWFEQYIVG